MERVKEFRFKHVGFASSVGLPSLSSEDKFPEGIHQRSGGTHLPMEMWCLVPSVSGWS